MKKRLAVLLAAAMLVTSMPFYAFAGDEDTVPDGGDPAAVVTDEENGEPAVTEEGDDNSGDIGDNEDPQPAEPEPEPDPQPVIQTGWNEDHTVYYDSNGNPLTNVVKKIDGVYYYFNKKGKLDMSNGWKKAGDNKYYIKKYKIVLAPTKIKVTKTVTQYYNKRTKKWQNTKIKGAKTRKVKVTKKYLYMFKKNGKLKTTKGLYKYKGKEYYGTGKGRLKTGWAAIREKKKGKAVYFDKKKGYMVKNKKVGHLKIPKNGRLGEAYYLGVKRLDKIGWSLRKAFRWSSRIRYQGRYYRAKDSETYAIKGFTKGYGNCYVMAATFYIMAKLMGYDVHQVEGRVDLPHSWTVIKQDGREWVYDPNFTNETGRNGYKIYYGKKGTWRYNHYHKMN